MKNKQLVSVRSNCDFSLNYETSELTPNAEIILITSSPKYMVDKKKESIVKDVEIEEFRFKSTLDGINKLIGELQVVVGNMNQFEQLSSGMNMLIKNSKKAE